jgi:hypothetical protein
MKKPSSKKTAPKSAGSETIRQCVIYVQAMAAYKAGFTADITNDWDHCGSNKGREGGKHLRASEHALRKLISISPACVSGRAPLTAQELFAKASVLSAILSQDAVAKDQTLSLDETTFVKFFAIEVEDHCQAEVRRAEKRKRIETPFMRRTARRDFESRFESTARQRPPLPRRNKRE